MKRDIITSAIGIVVLTLLLGILYPLVITGDQPGRVPGQRQRPEGLRQRQARRLEDHRPAVHRPGRQERQAAGRQERQPGHDPGPEVLPEPPVGDRPAVQRAPRRRSRTSGPNNIATEQAIAANIQAYLALEKPLRPRADGGQGPGRRRQHLGVGDRPRHLARERRHPGASRRGRAPPAALAGDVAGLQVHARARARVLRRAGRQRAAAQPRPRPSDRRTLMSVDTAPGSPAAPLSAARSRCSAATSSPAR